MTNSSYFSYSQIDQLMRVSIDFLWAKFTALKKGAVNLHFSTINTSVCLGTNAP